jgi:antitoxin ParD1/3/4
MNVSLPRELTAFVEDEVASGDHSTASEVVREALRLLRRERAHCEQKMAILRREIQIGLDDIEAGRISTRSVEDIARDVLARHRARGGT